MRPEEKEELLQEQRRLIDEIAYKSTRLAHIKNMLGEVATPAAPEDGKKPMPKHFGPDPNYVPNGPRTAADSLPNIGLPSKQTLDEHTVKWDSVTKK